ncbi:MAG: cytochrome c [Burkholderiaceae bacterium]|nr:cytochrome c [Burkholderiaceae bacterium]
MCNDEPRKRRTALAVLGFMVLLFALLSVFSFTGSREQALPQQVSFDGHSAVDGRRVFQAYNCMGCHTIVGNGAYFGPDLTDLYRRTGPAWLAAFLPSANAWPTAAAIRLQLRNPAVAEAAGTDDFDAYLERYPAAHERIERRGGKSTHMPTLPFTRDEIGQLVAFLRYTSELHTEGWPPVPMPGVREAAAAARDAGAGAGVGTTAIAHGASASGSTAAAVATAPSAATADLAAQGGQLASELGCLACHSKGTERVVGPGWAGLYGSQRALADGSSVSADDAYLVDSIVHPDAHVARDYPPGVMPSYEAITTAEQRDAIVAYIRSLGSSK